MPLIISSLSSSIPPPPNQTGSDAGEGKKNSATVPWRWYFFDFCPRSRVVSPPSLNSTDSPSHGSVNLTSHRTQSHHSVFQRPSHLHYAASTYTAQIMEKGSLLSSKALTGYQVASRLQCWPEELFHGGVE